MRQQEKESLLCSLYDASFHYGVNALRHEMSTQSRDVKKRSRDKLLHAIRGMDIDDDDDWPPEWTKDEEAAWASYRGEDNDE